MKNQKKAVKYALLAVFFWSTAATAFKLALENLNFDELIFYAVITSLIIMSVVITLKKEWYLLNLKQQLFNSVLNGLLNPFIYYLMLFKAYELLRAQEALALNYTWPIVLTLMSALFLKTGLRKKDIISMFISFSGALVIATKGSLLSLNIENPAGVAAGLGCAFFWGLFWIRNVKDTRPESVKLFCNFIPGLIFISVFLYFNTGFKAHPVMHILPAVYVGIFEMGITFYMWSKALSHAENTARISNLIYISPFLSMLIINTILQERILISSIAGLVLIIGGIIFSNS